MLILVAERETRQWRSLYALPEIRGSTMQNPFPQNAGPFGDVVEGMFEQSVHAMFPTWIVAGSRGAPGRTPVPSR